MSIEPKKTRRLWLTVALLVSVVGLTTRPSAQGTGQSFLFLQNGFTQELFGVSGNIVDISSLGILGGVAFAPDGDVWSSECTFLGTRLHRFDRDTPYLDAHGSTLHQESIVDLTAAGPHGQDVGGCGLTNHPDGFIYANSMTGIWRLDAASGQPIDATTGLPIAANAPLPAPGVGPIGGQQAIAGNALGIAVDPQGGPNNHIVYVGADCHPSLSPDATTCTLWDLDPLTGATQVFARLTRTEGSFIDGIYFDPSGQFVFGAHREFDFNTGLTNHSLVIIHRPATLLAPDAAPDDSQLVRRVHMDSEPDGVAFHAQQGFVVTLNESDDGLQLQGTMTRFDFPVDGTGQADYTQGPNATTFASGGFRGDLLQVGPDGCVYATQGHLFQSNASYNSYGVRYNDGTLGVENSIVQICGGFAPPPGVDNTSTPTPAGLGGYAYVDANRNGVFDAGEPPLAGVLIALQSSAAATTAADGSYGFTGLAAGPYTVTAPAAASGKALFTPSPLVVELAAGEQRSNVNFGYVPGALSGHVYVDSNRNGVFDVGEPIIPNVPITLTGSGGTMPTDSNGSYAFTGVDAGSHTVASPSTAGEYTLETPSPLPVTLAPGQTISDLDFGYVAPDICYVGTTHTDVGATQRVTIDQAAGTATVRTTFSRNFADNSYGVNAIGWPNGHTYSNLTGSDHIQLALYDALDTKKLEFKIDYITATATRASGYGTLCVSGGEGRMIVGTASDVVSCETSLSTNFNQLGYVLPVNSPASDANYTPNSLYPNWIWDVWYEVTVKLSAFGAAGFGKPFISGIHASPSKTGANTEIVAYCPPPSGGSCSISAGTMTFKSNQMKLPLKNNGTSAVSLSELTNLGWPSVNGKLKQVKLDGDVVWSGTLVSPASITSAMLTTSANKKSIAAGQTRTLVLVFEKNASTNLSGYAGSIKFDSGCELQFP